MKKDKNSEKTQLSMNDLIGFPKESLGYHLGNYLFRNSFEPDPVPERDDIYRLLLSGETSNKEDIAVLYYLCGNGNLRIRSLFIMMTGALLYPLSLPYFISKYNKGKTALRFYDLNHFKMLHLPLQRIKDTFLIR